MIASEVERLLHSAVAKVAPGVDADLALGPPKKPEWGDFASPVALVLGSKTGRKPREVAEAIAKALREDESSGQLVSKVEIAGPGFLNLTLADAFWHARLREILVEGERFGRSDVGAKRKVLVEYVSANPTGPLHVGHARQAAVGDTVANLLEAAGYEVGREFYVNDLGVQMNNLGRSVWYRALEASGKGAFPERVADEEKLGRKFTPEEARAFERFGGLYYGEYVKEIASAFLEDGGAKWLDGATDEAGVPEPPKEGIEAAREFAYPRMLEEQKNTLERYGVRFDRFFRERTLHEEGRVAQAVDDLQRDGKIYEKDGALWFNAKEYGDDKDRVIRKSDGSWTYFAPDIAYHRQKLLRGWEILIDVWGADHHGYIPRMRAALTALGLDPASFHVIIIQMVRLMSGGQELKMSKRSGSFVTLGELIDEVGPDAGRYLMLIRSPDSGLDFDLDLAKQQSNDNPVFYVQYGHARVCSVFAKAKEQAGAAGEVSPEQADLAALARPMEREMIKRLARFPEEVADAASKREPHRLAAYLQELVRAFHAYYSKKDESGAPEHRIVSEDRNLTSARLALAGALRIVLANGLRLCGVSAPEVMQKAEGPEHA